ncbi:cell division protein FtsL [Luteimonas sp. 8-5]|uniref:cell division protein FtsL n=1 Tax=Luteimonas sp. 8-5 TaxID=3039387 RepID=UPI002436E8EA|nr:cell division protein FtsL [Luteimonas sp. 8-5]MDG6347869.1 cell division protein FtsL [Luteimonas sp. 8-5]
MSTRVVFVIALLVLANVGSGVAVVFARHEHRQLFNELTRLERARDELNIEFGRLQLEQATWAESNRIDQVARTRLGMAFPETRDIVVVRP